MKMSVFYCITAQSYSEIPVTAAFFVFHTNLHSFMINNRFLNGFDLYQIDMGYSLWHTMQKKSYKMYNTFFYCNTLEKCRLFFPIISHACMRTNNLACLLQYWFSSVALNLLVCISWSRRFRGLRGGGWRYFGRRISLSAYEERCVWVPPGHTGTIIQQEWNLWGSMAGAVGGRQWWVWGRLRTVVPVPGPANLPQWRGRTHTVRKERRWRV